MQFCKTETYLNLARSFAGESQAGMRYQMIATQADGLGYAELAKEVRHIAHNETKHARTFYRELIENAGESQHILFQGTYPYQYGSLEDNLKYAAEGEHHEHATVYPAFATTAQEEGFPVLAELWQRIAEVEKNHNILFSYLHEAYLGGTLYASERPLLWICAECGYMHTAKQAWNICPICKASQGYVALHLPFGVE